MGRLIQNVSRCVALLSPSKISPPPCSTPASRGLASSRLAVALPMTVTPCAETKLRYIAVVRS